MQLQRLELSLGRGAVAAAASPGDDASPVSPARRGGDPAGAGAAAAELLADALERDDVLVREIRFQGGLMCAWGRSDMKISP